MKEKISNTIGFLLLGLCFVISLGRIMTSSSSKSEKDGRITIRIAHWQLENGVRSTIDKIAEEYTKLHPNVKVEQLAIPESIYTNWLVTQLVGETAPDLIEIGLGMNDERMARFFTPLTDLAIQANPYNNGTDLEGVPLRDTLFDGMEGGFMPSLLEYYSVPLSGASVRMFYNLDMLKQITGSETLPATYEELINLCQKAEAYAAVRNLPFVPIAGSKYNAPMIIKQLFFSQTQKMVEKLNPPGIFGEDFIRRADEFLQGRWSLDSEEVRSGFDLLHDLGKYMQPGFIQLQRDDATLTFVQQRSLIINTGSWDATGIRQQTKFRIGVASIPFPSPENPVYGKNTLGRISEAGVNGGVLFGITRGTKNAGVAKDFLLFLTSRKMNQVWTEESGWIPSVIGTKVDPEVAPFLPLSDGYMPGFHPTLTDTFRNLARLYSTNLYRLVGATGGTKAFLENIKPVYRNALIADLRHYRQVTLDISQRSDTQFGGLAWIAHTHPADVKAQERLDAIMQSASMNDRKFYRTRLSLEKATSHPAQ